MLCGEIIEILERQSPKEYAMDWDNVGLLVGRRDKEVKKLLIAVDATWEVCQMAIEEGVDLLITHHPMIFGKLNRVNDDQILGKKILSLIEAGIACYAMHTNFDTIGGMAKLAVKKLDLKNTEVLDETLNGEGIGQIGILEKSMTALEMAKLIKKKFDLKNVVLYGDKGKKLEKIAICPGSGKSVINVAAEKQADCLITGDIGHHEGIDAVELGLTVIDASHYGIEKIFMEYMSSYLTNACPGLWISVADVGMPFEVV